MKKKFALIVSLVIALSVAVCLFVFPTSADEPVYFDATAEANTIWDATGTKATVVTYNEQTIPAAEAEASLSDLNIGFTGGTYTLVDGVLTLNNATTAAADGRIRGTNGSLKVVINGADFYGAIGNDYPPYGDLLITSETGNKIIVSDQNNAIRSSGNLVVYGNVGFDLSHSSGADAAFVIDNSGSDANQRMILCPEVDSSIHWEGGSAGPIRSSRGNVIIGGSSYIDIDGGGYYAFLTNNDAAKEIKFVGTGVIDISTVDETIAYASSKPTFSVSEDVTVTFDSGTTAAFNGNPVNISGNAKVNIISTSNVLTQSTVSVSGNATVDVTSGGNATNFSTIGVSGEARLSVQSSGTVGYGGSLTVSEDAKVAISAASGHAIYGCTTTVSGNGEVTLNSDNGSAVYNATLTLSGNAVGNIYAAAGGNGVVNNTSNDITVSGNSVLNVSGVATNGIYLNDADVTISDASTVNMDVDASVGVDLFTWSTFSVTGGKLNVTGAITGSVFQGKHNSNTISFTGGNINLLVPTANTLFFNNTSSYNTNVTFTVGKNAKFTGLAKNLIGATGWTDATTLNFEAVDSGAVSNFNIVTSVGTVTTAGAAVFGYKQTNLGTDVPRLFTNSAAAVFSTTEVVRITDASSSVSLSQAAPVYGNLNAIYFASTDTLYLNGANVAKIEMFDDCNIIVEGTNVISNNAPNALWSAGGKTLTIYGPAQTSLSATATTQTLFADILTTSGDFVLNLTATTGCTMEPGSGVLTGEYLLGNKELNVVAAGGYAFCAYYGTGDLSFENCKFTASGVNSVVRMERAGDINFTNCEVNITATSPWALRADNGNVNLVDTTLVAEGPAEVISVNGAINVSRSSVTATANTGVYAIWSAGNMVFENSSLDATGTEYVVDVDGSASFINSSVESTGTSRGICVAGTTTFTGSKTIVDVTVGNNALTSTGLISITDGASVSVEATSGGWGVESTGSGIVIRDASVTATVSAHGAICSSGGSLTIDNSVINATAGSYYALRAGNGNAVIEGASLVVAQAPHTVLSASGSISVTEGSDVSAQAVNGYHAVKADGNITINASALNASATTSYTMESGGTVSLVDSAVTVTAGTSPAIQAASNLTVSGGTVTATANGVSSENSAAVLVNSGSLNVAGGVLTVNATLTGQNQDHTKFGAGIAVNAAASTDGLNIAGGEVIVETTANGAVGTSILIHNGLLNVGGTSEGKLAVYNYGTYAGYGSEASAAITLYPGTMNVQDNAKVYIYHQSDRGIYFLTKEGMSASWNTAAGLRVSGGQLEVYSAGSASIPFGQGKGVNGADKTAFTDNYKYTGGVVLAHTAYAGGYYVYDTTFLSGAVVNNYVFAGGMGRSVGDTAIVTSLEQHATFDRAGYASDWIYWGNDAAYRYYNPLNKGSGVLVSGNDTEGWTFKAPATTTSHQGQYDICGTVVEMNANEAYKHFNNPVIKMVNNQILYTSFDVQWSAMTFYYDAGTWDSAEQAYVGGAGWVHKTNGEVTPANVVVTNSGTMQVAVCLTYGATEGYTAYTGSVQLNGEAAVRPVNLSSGNALTYTVSLNGTPTESLDSAVIGTLTLTVGPALTSYDETLPHKFFATNTTDYAIQLYNLNNCSGNWNNLLNGDSCIEWAWSSSSSAYAGIIGNGITAAKLRNSPVWGEVVISCSTGGWVGVLDYDTKNILFETQVEGGPHDIEMLPNGDLAVIGSGGKLHYFSLSVSTSATPSHTLTTRGGHGVAWDPANECLWILEDYHIAKVTVNNYGTANASLAYVSGEEIYFGESDYAGHVLSPVSGHPGKYWVSATDYVWLFDSEAMTFELAPQAFQEDWVKGMAYFSDGTMIQTPGQFNSTNSADSWHSRGLRLIVWEDGLATEVAINASQDSFYKLFPVMTSYQ